MFIMAILCCDKTYLHQYSSLDYLQVHFLRCPYPLPAKPESQKMRSWKHKYHVAKLGAKSTHKTINTDFFEIFFWSRIEVDSHCDAKPLHSFHSLLSWDGFVLWTRNGRISGIQKINLHWTNGRSLFRFTGNEATGKGDTYSDLCKEVVSVDAAGS